MSWNWLTSTLLAFITAAAGVVTAGACLFASILEFLFFVDLRACEVLAGGVRPLVAGVLTGLAVGITWV